MTVRRTRDACISDCPAQPTKLLPRKLTLEELLLKLGLGDLNLNSLVDLLLVTAAVVGVVLDGGGEESVDEGSLAQAGLASDHDSESGTTLGDDLVALVGKLHMMSNLLSGHMFGFLRTLAMPIGDSDSAMSVVLEMTRRRGEGSRTQVLFKSW